MPSDPQTRYAITEQGDWELVGGGTGDSRIQGHAHPAAAGEDAIWHDIRVQSGHDEGYSDDVWGDAGVFHVIFSRKALKQLLDALRSWLALPLAEMGRSTFTYSANLSPVKSSSVTLAFGANDDLIIGTGETGCRLVMVVGTLRIETLLVVNPTTLEAFAEGLAAVLSRQGPDPLSGLS